MEGCFLTCSFHNCKRTYNHPDALDNHLKDHHTTPALSVPGKSFLCSTIGCEGSFGSMQQLMDHMRHHHKPNCFYLCESCRAKLRSYRTLLKHLQTCAKVAKSKAAQTEGGPASNPTFPGAHSDPHAFHPTVDEAQQMESEPSTPPQAPQAPSTPAAESAAAFRAAKPQSHPGASYSPFPRSLSPAPNPDPQRSARAGPFGLVTSSLQTPPGSNAVWRKNQDLPTPILHRWNSPQALSREEVQEETGVPGVNPRKHGENMQTPHRKTPCLSGDSNLGPSCYAATGSTLSLVKTATDSENSSYTQL